MSRGRETRKIEVAGVEFTVPGGRDGNDLAVALGELGGALEAAGAGASWADIPGIGAVMRRLDGLRIACDFPAAVREGIDRIWKRYGNDLAEKDYRTEVGVPAAARRLARIIREWEEWLGEETGWAGCAGMREFMRDVRDLRAGGMKGVRAKDRETIEWGWQKYCADRAREELVDDRAVGRVIELRGDLLRPRTLDTREREEAEGLWRGGGLCRLYLDELGCAMGWRAKEVLGDMMDQEMMSWKHL